MDSQTHASALDTLRFDNRFTRELPADPIDDNYCRQVTGACFSRVQPRSVIKPQLVAFAREVAAQLGLSEEACRSEAFAEVFVGNRLLDGMEPFAMCYGGHQFGNWAGQLGDGRAINLGEVLNAQGERYTLQLKGAGPTPYARQADGLAVLRSSVREFLCSEAMHHLGVPTTRALSLVLTGEQVSRDMFYDGHPKLEPGAVVCRVAPSFLRFGSFQILSARRDHTLLKQLLDYCIRTDFPELGEPSPEVYAAWFEEVCRRTAEMIVHWMRVGFVHGVMNTDNMSVLGLTIDYGPYGWLEDFDPDWTPNTTDAHQRRYRYGQQPQIAMWNLVQLANAIYPLLEHTEPFQRGLDAYADTYERANTRMLAHKLGLQDYQADSDDGLTTELLVILQLVETDMTLFYRCLAEVELAKATDSNISDTELMEPLMEAYYRPSELTDDYRQRLRGWLSQYAARAASDPLDDNARRQLMNRTNPKYVLRNYLAQLAIDQAEQGEFSMIEELLEVLRHPYDDQPGMEKYAEKRPDWARTKPGCSMLSCSS
ncbi:protein adenylyltransferase SelO [Marinobacterium arenosum]|uniref:protein adenylyltransferase SelO n=1 Tax=Marinobacterium arenosum TaxID=2862496 RepID=UPI001C97EB59|nr:YdiU family protein [Marinobacterium arenosum]MBY4678262.1 YdiU family protein [Marinobacterium arenosum]